MITIIGNHVSPYVRKVLAALELKGVPYRVDPIVPFFGDERFAELSPLRRVPVLIDGDLVLPDSTVICEYLDEAYAGPKLLPAEPKARARARWIEEFADSRLGDVLVWRLFFGTLIGPRVLGRPKDEAALAKVVAEDVPAALAQAEALLPETGLLFGEQPTTADFAIGAMLQMPGFVRQPIDAARFPRCAAFVATVGALPAMARLMPIADLIMRTPPAEQRAALAAVGVALVPESESVNGATPRPRIMETA
jgi:glutathione S-transferase